MRNGHTIAFVTCGKKFMCVLCSADSCNQGVQPVLFDEEIQVMGSRSSETWDVNSIMAAKGLDYSENAVNTDFLILPFFRILPNTAKSQHSANSRSPKSFCSPRLDSSGPSDTVRARIAFPMQPNVIRQSASPNFSYSRRRAFPSKGPLYIYACI
jgi:hypothetical protein